MNDEMMTVPTDDTEL